MAPTKCRRGSSTAGSRRAFASYRKRRREVVSRSRASCHSAILATPIQHISSSDPGQVRTADLRFRKPPLYPAELRDRERAGPRGLARSACCTRRDTKTGTGCGPTQTRLGRRGAGVNGGRRGTVELRRRAGTDPKAFGQHGMETNAEQSIEGAASRDRARSGSAGGTDQEQGSEGRRRKGEGAEAGLGWNRQILRQIRGGGGELGPSADSRTGRSSVACDATGWDRCSKGPLGQPIEGPS